MEKHDEIKEKKCPVCGKSFIPAPYHIYKSKNRMVCSYHCQLASEEKREKKELDYGAIGDDRTSRQSKRYAIYARRAETDRWTAWSEVDDIDSALGQRNFGESYGFLMKIVDMPIEVYLNQGARDAYARLQGYIAKNEIQISNENLDSVLKEVLEEVLKAIPTKEQDNV